MFNNDTDTWFIQVYKIAQFNRVLKTWNTTLTCMQFICLRNDVKDPCQFICVILNSQNVLPIYVQPFIKCLASHFFSSMSVQYSQVIPCHSRSIIDLLE